MSKAPEITKVEPIPETETYESLVWDGSNTVKALKFLGEGWVLMPEASHSDVSGRTWVVSKHLKHVLGYPVAEVADVLIKASSGDTWSLTPEQFKQLYREVKK